MGVSRKRFGAIGLVILTIALFSSIAFASAPSITINQPLSGYYNGLLRIDFNWSDTNEIHSAVDVNLFIFTAGSAPDANFLYDSNILDKNMLGTETNSYTNATVVSGGCVDHDSNAATSNRCIFDLNTLNTSLVRSDGNYQIDINLTDNAGSRGTARSASITVDNTAPTISAFTRTFSSLVSGYTSDSNGTWTITVTDSNSGAFDMNFSCDGATFDANRVFAASVTDFNSASGSNGCAVSDGNHTVTVAVRDRAMNRTTSASATFNLDRIAPTISAFTRTFSSLVSGYTNDANGTWTITASDSNSALYDMNLSCDGSAFDANAAFASSRTDFNSASSSNGCAISDGNRTVTVAVRDRAMNRATSTSTTFNLDRAAPTISAFTRSFGSVSGYTNDSNGTWTITATDSNSGLFDMNFTCDSNATFDANRAFSSTRTDFNSASGNLSCDLLDGNRTVRIAVRDRAMNRTTSDSASFNLDRTAPTLVSGNWTAPVDDYNFNTSTVDLNGTASDTNSSVYQVWVSDNNGTTFSLATGTTTWGKTLAHGYSVSTDFNLQVKAQDRADNNSTALIRLIHYDKNATFTNTTASSFLNATNVTITGTTDINATCKIDSSSSVAFASMATLMSASNSGLSHSGSVAVSSGNQAWYVKCQDTQANTSANFTVSFEVVTGGGGSPPAPTPSPPGGGTPGGSGGLPPQSQAPAIVREIVATARSFSQTPGSPDVNRLLSLVGASPAAIENAVQASQKVQLNRELSVTQITDSGKKRFESTISVHVSNIARTELRNVVVVEEIPKSIAADASQIQSAMPFTVLQSDPILSFTIDRIPANGEAIVSYTVAQEVKQSDFLTSFASAPIVSQASFDQPVVESVEPTPKPKKSPAVGSAVQSTPFPTGTVAAAVIVLALIIGAAYWFWKRKHGA